MMSEILSQFDLYTLLVVAHITGTAIGVGGATFSDILFFKSIEDGKISKQEFNLMHAGGMAIWGGLAILILSGAGMVAYHYFVNDFFLLATSEKIQAKLVIVGMILLNGLFLHLKIFPLFRKSLDQDVTKELFVKHADIIFTSGAVSATSWYAAMTLGALGRISISLYIILAFYFSVLILAIISAQIIGRIKIAQIRKKLGAEELKKTTPPPPSKTDSI